MIIDESGKIGIGTENPLTTLHITGTDGIIIPYGITNDLFLMIILKVC